MGLLWRRRGLACASILTVFICGTTSAHAAEIRTVALSGQQAPGTPSGVNYNFLGTPVLNDAGQTAFYARLTDATNNNSIWSEGSGSLTLVARAGSHAPGTPSGVNYGNDFETPVLNDAGQIAFFATNLPGSGVVLGINDGGIWSEGSGSLALVARVGDHAPGTPNGVNYYDVYDPVLNNAGQTAFLAVLTSIGVNGGLGTGLWSEGSDSLALVARSDDPAPGTPDGVNFSNFNFFDVPFVLNDAGQTAFLASLTGSGVDSTNDRGIWATDSNGDLQLIAREGDPLQVAPGDLRTVGGLGVDTGLENGASNSDGRPTFFNNRGQLAFWAGFTDGTSGIFVSNRVAVPEPSAFLLAAAAITATFGTARGGRSYGRARRLSWIPATGEFDSGANRTAACPISVKR